MGVRRSDDDGAIAAVEAAKLMPAVNADHFLKMAVLVTDSNIQQCGAARKAALTADLGRLTSQPNMKYGAVAGVRLYINNIVCTRDKMNYDIEINVFSYISVSLQVIRALLECSNTDADRLNTLRDAAALFTAAPAGAFPPLEARYLITTAWNRGATHSKVGRMSVAEAFMGIAIRMVKSTNSSDAMEIEGQEAAGNLPGLSEEDKVRLCYSKFAFLRSWIETTVSCLGNINLILNKGYISKD